MDHNRQIDFTLTPSSGGTPAAPAQIILPRKLYVVAPAVPDFPSFEDCSATFTSVTASSALVDTVVYHCHCPPLQVVMDGVHNLAKLA